MVFRVGNQYFSTKKVDLEKNLIIMREHSASDYKRVELVMGAELPDFTFSDFDGKKHKLSEFRGKFVLIDFWATWCKPCLADIPHLKELSEKYKDKGFEILGMDSETLSPDEEADAEFARAAGCRVVLIPNGSRS